MAGSLSQVYGDRVTSSSQPQSSFGARDMLQVGLTTKRHATKACAYSPSQEDRARIPADVKQHYFESTDSATGLTSRHYGIEIGGAAISADSMYRRLWLREKAADIVHKIHLVSKGFAVIDPQSGHAVNNYSLQALGEYIMKVHPASDTVEFASTVDKAMREAFNLCLGVDLLDSAGHTGSNAPDPSLTHDRALLRGRTGGASIRPLSHRPHFLSCLCNCLPLMLDSTGPDGSKTKGFFPNLVNILGKNSFDADNDSTRYSTFLQSSSLIASDFKAEYFKHKDIFEALCLKNPPEPSVSSDSPPPSSHL